VGDVSLGGNEEDNGRGKVENPMTDKCKAEGGEQLEVVFPRRIEPVNRVTTQRAGTEERDRPEQTGGGEDDPKG
jgi:hypothetical protein